MEYFNPIYVITHLFGHKIHILLNDFLFCKTSPYGLYIFEIVMLIHLLYSDNATFNK